MNINTFIFDLGGVIIDLDEAATINSFSKMTGISQDEVLHKIENSGFFQSYEKGLVTDQIFRKAVNELFQCKLSDKQIDKAWNAMLKSIPTDRLKLLLALKKKYKVAILSNTNAIHIREFNKILEKASGQNSLTYFAHHVFFSHDLNMRKPDKEIYQETLKRLMSLEAETIFIDDKLENIEGAKTVGINTLHINNPEQIFELRKYV